MACRLADLSEGLASTTAVRCEAVDLLGQALAAVRTGRPTSVQTDAQAPWGLRFRPIAGAGFHVVLEGSCYLRPPAGDPIRLAEGDVVFLRRGSAHVLCDDLTTEPIDFVPERVEEGSPIGRIVLDGPGERTLIVCGAYQLDYRPHPVLGELPDVVHLPASATHHPALRATVQQLHAELEAPGTGSTHIVSELLDLMFLYILRAWFADQPKDQATGWSAAFADPPIARSLRAIHDDPARSWTIEALGSVAGLSRAAFARRFTQLTGQPPLAYVTTWRMSIAAQLLRQTDTSIASVASRIGYSTEFAFAKAFKRHYGVAPGTYRRQNQAA
jgi:AraC-like DNA-binding protein